ncbi:NAD(P)/FAD-dependent oxidoreductase [Actibacterium sp. 188UL27-1]|uniref:NAD(P)/FAD-dependent oxidoreductase n=1 Tax=Actibacterium sp. 188UL27-1 TaxID=2786961 RepID=UPI001956AA3D|nr:NAD(P)/FAD-dependent oxidoreductase [Actibacterium sp. 188UL27-1]MBM7068897.1 NAD(P)/FAD-dependent oxidoreductase [Actibacterium sp. 188UL27-1]
MQIDTMIVGAGAAGLMCAAHAGPGTLVVDHARAAGEKIRISGGGRCNFTNLHTAPENFLSENPHFAKSALSRYTQWDFIDLVDRSGIAWHEKTLGQLFCDEKATQITAMLITELRAAGADLWTGTQFVSIAHHDGRFHVALQRDGQDITAVARHLVVATGGKSIPKMGATGLAYQIADQFGLPMVETRPALVPLTFGEDVMDRLKPLSGVSTPARVSAGGSSFDEALLFTHRGLSGPAILQASSYWEERSPITIRLCPDLDLSGALKTLRRSEPRKTLATALANLLPKSLAELKAQEAGITGNMADQSDATLDRIADSLTDWQITPKGTEGYRTAEVTAGGVATTALSSRSMESPVPGLYFIGECVDVTGWLGGYNFQWAWSSGWAAGQAIAARSL